MIAPLYKYLLVWGLWLSVSLLPAADLWTNYPRPVAGGIAVIVLNHNKQTMPPMIYYKKRRVLVVKKDTQRHTSYKLVG